MIDGSELVFHPFQAVWAPDSRVLVLGTMPSRQSRRRGFYYGHPQNRFWPLLESLLGDNMPEGPEDRRDFLIRHRIALWDVLQSCEIQGSRDHTIRVAQANNIRGLLELCPIRTIFANGQAAARLYRLLCQPETGQPCVALPSTSPANGRFSLEMLRLAWQPLVDDLV